MKWIFSLFEEIPHKKINFFSFIHLNVRNFRHMIQKKNVFSVSYNFDASNSG